MKTMMDLARGLGEHEASPATSPYDLTSTGEIAVMVSTAAVERGPSEGARSGSTETVTV